MASEARTYTAFTRDRQDRFLELLEKGHTVTYAAERCRIDRRTAYLHRQSDPAFRVRWDEAIECGVEVLEEEAIRRAVTGTLRPVYQGGERVGSVREYSDNLLMFLLKGRRPDLYRENSSVELTGKGGRAIQVQGTQADVATLTDEELELIARGDGLSVRPVISGASDGLPR